MGYRIFVLLVSMAFWVCLERVQGAETSTSLFSSGLVKEGSGTLVLGGSVIVINPGGNWNFPNQPPSISRGRDQKLSTPGSVRLFGRAEDDGRPMVQSLSKEWMVIAGSSPVTFSDTTADGTTVTVTQPGVYRVKLRATDTQYETDTTFIVEVGRPLDPGTALITFEGRQWEFGQTTAPVSQWQEAEFVLAAPPEGLSLVRGQADSWSFNYWNGGPHPANGTDALRVTFPGLHLRHKNGHRFRLESVDLCKLQAQDQPHTVRFVGTKWDGTKVEKSFTITRVGDNGGVLLDFETLDFGEEFSDLVAVEEENGGFMVDNLRVKAGEAPPVENQSPQVLAGGEQTILMPDVAVLAGQVTDDSLPWAALSCEWSTVSGPGPVVFESATARETKAAFTVPGTYVLRLTASDGLVTSASDVTIHATGPNFPPQVQTPERITTTVGETFTIEAKVEDDGLPGTGITFTLWNPVAGHTNAIEQVSPAGANATLQAVKSGVHRVECQIGDGQLTVRKVVEITVLPRVNAGPDLSVAYPEAARIHVEEIDYGPSIATGSRTRYWTRISGPGEVTFGPRHWEEIGTVKSFGGTLPATTPASQSGYVRYVHFSKPGRYVLALKASEGALTGGDEITVDVLPPVDMYHGGYRGVVMHGGRAAGNVQLQLQRAADTGGGEVFHFTGTIQIGKQRWRIKGSSSDGSWTGTVQFPGRTTAEVSLQVDWEQGNGFSISVKHGAEEYTAGLDKQADPGNAYAGQYTMLLPVSEWEGSSALGHGYGTVTVSTEGNVRAVAVLADGTSVSFSGVLTKHGIVAIYKAAGRKAVVAGSFQFSQPWQDHGTSVWMGAVELTGSLTKSTVVRASQPANSMVMNVQASPFVAGTTSFDTFLAAPGSTSTRISFISMKGVQSVPFTRSGGNKAGIIASGRGLEIHFTKSGYFSGSFRNPSTKQKATFGGVLLQDKAIGGGLYRQGGVKGRVEIK